MASNAKRLLKKALALLSAKDDLLIAYRLGSHTRADRALTKLEKLECVPDEIAAFLAGEKRDGKA